MKTIWEDSGRVHPMVSQRPDKGLVFSYNPVFHGGGRCSFTMWCEVGERYRDFFDDFFEGHTLASEPMRLSDHPYICDLLK